MTNVHGSRPVTWDEAGKEPDGRLRAVSELLAHWSELTGRDLNERTITTLRARGSHDPAVHGDAARHPPLTVSEHLVVLALGEAIGRVVRPRPRCTTRSWPGPPGRRSPQPPARTSSRRGWPTECGRTGSAA